MGIYLVTAQLAHKSAYYLVIRKIVDKSCEVLDFFFGGPMPLPDFSIILYIICKTFIDFRRYVIELGKQSEGYRRIKS